MLNNVSHILEHVYFLFYLHPDKSAKTSGENVK